MQRNAEVVTFYDPIKIGTILNAGISIRRKKIKIF